MKKINTYIIENTQKLSSKDNKKISEVIYKMFNKTKLSKDNIILLLNNIDMNILKEFSNYIGVIDPENSLPYIPQDDIFINPDNNEKIISMLSEYILKFIAN